MAAVRGLAEGIAPRVSAELLVAGASLIATIL